MTIMERESGPTARAVRRSFIPSNEARMFTILKQLLPASSDSDTVYECRHCGTSVASRIAVCPECNRNEIVGFKL